MISNMDPYMNVLAVDSTTSKQIISNFDRALPVSATYAEPSAAWLHADLH